MRRSIFFLLLLVCSSGPLGFSQTTYYPLNSEEYTLIDRLEAASGRLLPFPTSYKPIARRDAVAFFEEQQKNARFFQSKQSDLDQKNIERAISISGEWVAAADGMNGSAFSRRPVLRHFYVREADFIHVQTEDFFLAANPVIYTQGIYERDADGLRYLNLRGAEVRGRISDRVGFYSLLADDQERPYTYVAEYERQQNAFPGMDFGRRLKNDRYDMFLARAYVDVGFFQEHLNLSFGYDHHFIGDGIRSLFLSNSGAPATFLRMRGHFGRFSYQSLFLEAITDIRSQRGDRLLPKKYLSLQKLDVQLAPQLRVGLFEASSFAQDRRVSPEMFVPVIFYQTISQAAGARQRTSWGFDFKAIAFRTLQLYGQAYLENIDFSRLGEGYWKNQFGGQIGFKYSTAFRLEGFDLQGEANVVRPFTYSAPSPNENYAHYNQALAHPFGAGFREFLLRLNYQPVSKWTLSAQMSYATRGFDTTTQESTGTDIFKSTDLRSSDIGYSLLPSDVLNGLFLNLHTNYELRPRLFLELGFQSLQRTATAGASIPASTSVYGGLRWNFSRKVYDFY